LVAWSDDGLGGRIGSVLRFSTTDLEVGHVKLDLEPALRLRGFVSASPESGGAPNGSGYLYLGSDERVNPEFSAQVAIRAGGAFEIAGLLPGKYHLSVNALSGWIVSKMEIGAVDAVHQTFTFDNVSRLGVTLSRGFGAVTGSLTEGNAPRDNAVVVLAPEPIPKDAWLNTFPWTHLDENGRYEFNYIVPGRYRVIPFYGSTLNLYHDLSALREHAHGYREVNVLPGKTVAGVNFASQQ
jgi:hypothetical protein